MRRHLLGSDTIEENLHVVQMRPHKRGLIRVVGVNVSLVEFVELIGVVSLTVLGLVLSFNTITNMNYKTVPN